MVGQAMEERAALEAAPVRVWSPDDTVRANFRVPYITTLILMDPERDGVFHSCFESSIGLRTLT